MADEFLPRMVSFAQLLSSHRDISCLQRDQQRMRSTISPLLFQLQSEPELVETAL